MNGRTGTSQLLIAAVSVISFAPAVVAQGICNLFGEVYVTNPFDQTLMIKGDGSADISTVQFSNQTQFVHVTVERKPAGGFDPKDFQTGDRLCVQFGTAQAKLAARILVMKRLEIQEHQKQVFSELAHNSAFGVVTDLNAEKRTIRLKEELGDGVAQQLTVDASDPVVFRHFSSAAQVGKEGIASDWGRMQVGDSIYVQGRRDTTSPVIRAGIVVEGGARGIVGTIVSMSGLGEAIELHEFGSGKSLIVQTRRDAIFRASPFVEAATAPERSGIAASWDLYSISFSDLQKGDTISVLTRGRQGEQNTVTGLMVVTGFGSYGINALPPGAPAFWYIDPLKAAR